LRKADIVAGPVEHASFDLVTARAVLHRVADAQAAIVNMVAGLKAGGALLLIEPDFLPVSIAEPPRCVRSGPAGFHGLENEELIITLGGHLRFGYRRLA
jgi:hypothetical protein